MNDHVEVDALTHDPPEGTDAQARDRVVMTVAVGRGNRDVQAAVHAASGQHALVKAPAGNVRKADQAAVHGGNDPHAQAKARAENAPRAADQADLAHAHPADPMSAGPRGRRNRGSDKAGMNAPSLRTTHKPAAPSAKGSAAIASACRILRTRV